MDAADFFDPNPPQRIGEVLAALRLPRRTRIEVGADEEGRPTLLVTCGCGALSLKTLAGTLDTLPGEICVTCEVCLAPAWVAVS